MELERKILLRSLPERLDRPELITQGYLYVDPFELRLRKKGSKCVLTYKSLSDEEREEWEKEIPCWLYDELLTKHIGRIIRKKRYNIVRDGVMYEIDEYLKDFEGLIVAEVEFNNRKDLMHSRYQHGWENK